MNSAAISETDLMLQWASNETKVSVMHIPTGKSAWCDAHGSVRKNRECAVMALQTMVDNIQMEAPQ